MDKYQLNNYLYFRLCDPVEKSIENPLDISNLFEALASNFAGVVQYNKDYSPHATVTIDQICDIMVNTTIGPPVSRLAEVNRVLLVEQKEKCLDYKYDKMISEMKNTSWKSKVADGGIIRDSLNRLRFLEIQEILFQLDNGLIRLVLNLASIRRLTMPQNLYLAIVSM